MSDRVTDTLRAAAEPAWTEATTHRFTEQLGEGTLPDEVFRVYLLQDYVFLDALASLVGYAIAQAPSYRSKQRLTAFLGSITDEESDYFERSFEQLGVPESRWRDPQPTATTRAFVDLVHRAGARGGYAESLAVLVAAEWVYGTWAANAPDSRPDAFYLAEWVDLHDTPAFHDTVEWLRAELDQAGVPESEETELQRLFSRTVDLEVAFFDAAFEHAAVSVDG